MIIVEAEDVASEREGTLTRSLREGVRREK